MLGSLRLVTAAPDEGPVGLDRFKLQARIDSSAEDALLAAYLKAAVAWLDGPSGILRGRALMTQTWDWRLDDWSGFRDLGGGLQGVESPLSPLQSVTHIKYLDAAGAEQTLDPANYQVDAYSTPGRILLAPGGSLPGLRGGGRGNQVTIRIVAGWGSNPTDVPEDLRLAITIIATDFHENRRSFELGAGGVIDIPRSADALLAKYRLAWFG